MAEDNQRILQGKEPVPASDSPEAVTKLPKAFTDWMERNADRIEAAYKRGTLPCFLKDNKSALPFRLPPIKPKPQRKRQAPVIQHSPSPAIPPVLQQAARRHAERTEAETADIKRRWKGFKEYQRYKASADYKNARFDYRTGAVMAIHREHNLDKKKGWYELAVQKAGFEAGHSVILELEDHTKHNVRNTEGTWDGLKFEVAAAETGLSNNIRNAFKHCAKKPDCDVAVVFFLEEINPDALREGFAKYNGLKGTPQWKAFKSIYLVVRNGAIKHLPPLN